MVIKLQPVFIDKIWGGDSLQKTFHYPSGSTCGEAWGISAHKSFSSTISNTKYKGLTLRELYQNHRHLFGFYEENEFPILVKLIDATSDLSIQVHPDNAYAKRENSLGKEECWTILEARKDASILIGHTAQNKEEFKQAIVNKTVLDICKMHPIKAGDFFYIESGTVHAILAGTMLLEVQQSSDITYRIYDYDRTDQHNKKRALHIDNALDVIHFPDHELQTKPTQEFFHYSVHEVTKDTFLVASKYGDYLFILEGEGYIDELFIQKGDFLMIPANNAYHIIGTLKYQKTTF